MHDPEAKSSPSAQASGKPPAPEHSGAQIAQPGKDRPGKDRPGKDRPGEDPPLKTPPEDGEEEEPGPVWHQPLLLALFVLCLLPELVLTGADWGLWGSPRWRIIAVRYGGFWPGLLQGWRPNYSGQSVFMFISYAFLHSGIVHFGVNMTTLFSLGPSLGERFGQGRLLVLYIGSALGGAIAFALFSEGNQPMVGSSGALFGLAGAVVSLAYREIRSEGGRLAPILKAVGILVLLNLIMWWAMDGKLAWEAHLGGFVAGWGLAILFSSDKV